MTNEELAVLIQRGHREYYAELWEQVYKLIQSLIYKEARKRKLPQGIDTEDLLQSGYFAMVAAVKAFKPDSKLKFTSYLNFHVLNSVNTELCYGTRNKKHIKGYSYNVPAGGESEDTEQIDLIADESLEGLYERVELTEVQQIVTQAVGELPDIQQDIIRMHELQEMDLIRVAAALGVTYANARKQKYQAFRTLRRDRNIQALHESYSQHNHNTSLAKCMWNGSTEQYAMLSEHNH